MAKIEVYSGPRCPYCVRVKQLFDKKGVEYIDYDVSQDDTKRTEMMERANGARTIPQVFIDGTHYGGSDDIHALDKDGKLDGLIGV